MVTFVGAGDNYTGWVVPQGATWQTSPVDGEHAVPVGAYVPSGAPDTDEILVDYCARRPSNGRIANLTWAGRLAFEMNKVQVACEYDDTPIVATEDVESRPTASS